MKSKDYVFYVVSIFSLALLILSPIIIDGVYGQDAPINDVFNTWLAYGENFVNAMVYPAGY